MSDGADFEAFRPNLRLDRLSRGGRFRVLDVTEELLDCDVEGNVVSSEDWRVDASSAQSDTRDKVLCSANWRMIVGSVW